MGNSWYLFQGSYEERMMDTVQYILSHPISHWISALLDKASCFFVRKHKERNLRDNILREKLYGFVNIGDFDIED